MHELKDSVGEAQQQQPINTTLHEKDNDVTEETLESGGTVARQSRSASTSSEAHPAGDENGRIINNTTESFQQSDRRTGESSGWRSYFDRERVQTVLPLAVTIVCLCVAIRMARD